MQLQTSHDWRKFALHECRIIDYLLRNGHVSRFFLCGAATQRGSWLPHSSGFLDHTQRRTTAGRTPLDEWSTRRRDLYLTTQTLTTDKHPCPGGIRTHDLSRRAAINLRLRPRGHWDRHTWVDIGSLTLIFKTSVWGPGFNSPVYVWTEYVGKLLLKC